MKNAAVVLSILAGIFSTGKAFAAAGDVTPGLNQCSPVMDSKVYSTTDFHAYPREVAFECTYKCNSNGRIDTIRGTTRVIIRDMQEDAFGTTCQGVMMKKVPWGYDFDKIAPFYAPDTGIPELKIWAFQNINFNPIVNQLEKERLEILKKDLNTIAGSFIMAGFNGGSATAHFKEAGLRLSAVAEGLPMNTKLLDEEIKNVIVNRGQRAANGTVDSLLIPMLTNSAAWRIPVK